MLNHKRLGGHFETRMEKYKPGYSAVISLDDVTTKHFSFSTDYISDALEIFFSRRCCGFYKEFFQSSIIMLWFLITMRSAVVLFMDLSDKEPANRMRVVWSGFPRRANDYAQKRHAKLNELCEVEYGAFFYGAISAFVHQVDYRE